jgi:hypothetical protein
MTLNESIVDSVVENIVGGKKNIILDATVLSAFMACPRFADFRFNHNLVPIEGKSNSLEAGSIVHKFLEVYYGSIIQGLTKSQAEGFAFTAAELYISGCKFCTEFTPIHNVIQGDEYRADVEHVCNETCILKPECGHRINDYPGTPNTPREPDTSNPQEKYKLGWMYILDTCRQYLEYYRNDHWVPLFVETVKGEILYEDEEIRILWKSKLDLVVDSNQGIYPVDHKTMKQNRTTKSTQSNQFKGQCIIMRTNRVLVNKVGFQKTLKPEEKFIRVPITYSNARLMEWQSQTLPYYAKLLLMYSETGYFPPQLGSCEGTYGDCMYLEHVCEEDPDNRERQLKTSNE